jgi:hypothetical protein
MLSDHGKSLVSDRKNTFRTPDSPQISLTVGIYNGSDDGMKNDVEEFFDRKRRRCDSKALLPARKRERDIHARVAYREK